MNSYADDLLLKMSDAGMNENLWNVFYKDYSKIKKYGIQSDKERNLLFCVEDVLSNVCKKSGLELTDELTQKIFNVVRKENKIDKVFDVIGKTLSVVMYKRAYPNIGGVAENNAVPERDVNKWIKTLGEIHLLREQGFKYQDITQKLLEGWDNMEKKDFQHWLKYYEDGDHEKYQVKTAEPVGNINFQAPKSMFPQPTPQPVMPEAVMPEAVMPEAVMPEAVEPELSVRQKRVKGPQENRKALLGRLDAAERLLREFSGVWPQDKLNALFDYLAQLKRIISTLETKASMVDCIVRTASVWGKSGFPEGAECLMKIAEESDLASQIEKALSGKEYEKEGDEPPPEMGGSPTDAPPEMAGMEGMPPDAPAPDAPPPGMEAPPAGAPAELTPEPPLAGAEEPMPPPAELPEAPETTEPTNKENPFAGSSVADVVDILEKVLKQIQERETFRELSKTDMMLSGLNMATHFPELSEIIGHLLEANNYVSTRLDKMISKLKGGLDNDGKEKEKPEAPLVEMEELQAPTTEQPVPPVAPVAPALEAPPAEAVAPAAEAPAPETPLVEVKEQ